MNMATMSATLIYLALLIATCAQAKLYIEEEGLYQEGSLPTRLQPDENVNQLTCPINQAVDVKPQYANDVDAKALANLIRANISVKQWYKDGKLLHRENGNFIITQLDIDPNSKALLSVTSSDGGFYNCTLNFSNVNPEYHNLTNEYLRLYPSIEFEVEIADLQDSLPDIAPQITHPPYPQEATLGQNITFTCHHLDTLLSQRVDWFRSYCTNISDNAIQGSCKDKFFTAYHKSLEREVKTIDYMRPYFIEGEDGETLTIHTVDKDDADTYGCMVSNHLGLDIRIARLDLSSNGSRERALPASSGPNSDQSNISTYIYLCLVVIVSILTLAILGFSLLCNTSYGVKICTKSKLIKEVSKENSDRQHLPKVLSPDIYNVSKLGESCIYGQLHQKGGHLMDQAMNSPKMVIEKNLSISSNNYHSNDETSSWGKSLSSSGDNSRAFYQHTSNNTATTVPLYDHPPSTGTTLPSGAPFQASCVINPTYGFLRQDFEVTTSNWTFNRRNLEPQGIIGKGQFGEVWRYVARQKDGSAGFVAVKKLTVRTGQEQQAKDEILKEIDIMKRVNEHPNVIKFLNTCVEPTKILLIMEYADNGTLQLYLRNSRHIKDKDGSSITSKELLKYAYHVAKGMEYIASKGIVHRDLATRNILLSKDKVCKVADFGLARVVGDGGIYQRLDRNQPVPIKWMAPESLSEYGTYTSKSDVFSAGILMWEIVTLGATPYDLLSSNEVLKKVVSGERLPRPEHCKDEFYNIMYRCWHQDPTQRPTFEKVAEDLDVLVQSENDYIQLDKYPEHAYYNINTNKNAEKELVSSLPFYPELDNVFEQC